MGAAVFRQRKARSRRPQGSIRTVERSLNLPGNARNPDYEVWESPDVFAGRDRKVAVALAAVARLLDERKPLQGAESEFLALYSELHELSSSAFTRLARSPETYAWVRHCYALVRNLFESEDRDRARPVESIAGQLERFKRLALGAFISDRKSIRFTRPIRGELPLSLPCTDLLLFGEGEVEIFGYEGGELELAASGEAVSRLPISGAKPRAGSTVSLQRQPVISPGSREIILGPFVFQSSHIESPDRQNTLALGLEGHVRTAPLVSEAFRVIRAHAPDAFEQITENVSHIGLNDPEQSDRSQTCLSDMPGTFIVPFYVNPYSGADVIIHEYYHNRLFALEESGRIFTDDSDERGEGVSSIFSPWRLASRPVKGLLHSTFVFIPVTRFWLSVYENTPESDPIHAVARDDCIRQILNLKAGMHLLDKHGDFTAHGRVIVESMRARVNEIIERSMAAGLEHDATAMNSNLDGSITPLRWTGYDQPVGVRENLRVNIRNHDLNGDLRDLPFEI